MLKNNETLHILLAEDNEGDVILLKERFSQSEYPFVLDTAKDGEEVVDILQKSDYQPHIILLDVNMPKSDGFDVLRTLKEDNQLKHIPVIMVTSSTYPDDIEMAKEYGANGYLNKPGDADLTDLVTFLDLVSKNPDTWIHIPNEGLCN